MSDEPKKSPRARALDHVNLEANLTLTVVTAMDAGWTREEFVLACAGAWDTAEAEVREIEEDESDEDIRVRGAS